MIGNHPDPVDGDPSGPEECEDDLLTDLNALAMAEFRRLLETDTMLSASWKHAAMKISAGDISLNLEAMQKLLEGVTDASSEEAQR